MAALLIVSIVVHRDGPPRAEMCATYQALQSSAQRLVATAEQPGNSATQLRDIADEVLADLAALQNATDDQFDDQIGMLTLRMGELRASLADVDGATPTKSARALIDDTLADLRPAAEELVRAIEPICTTDDR